MDFLLDYKGRSLIGKRVVRFGYKVVDVEPISKLYKYKDHRRLQTYFQKGVECVVTDCNFKGKYIVHALDKQGNIHIDICDENLVPLTIDHIIPKSKGGDNHISNYQPMCVHCNGLKSNIYGPISKIGGHEREEYNSAFSISNFEKPDISNLKIGQLVYVASGKRKKRVVLLGKIEDIRPNPNHPNNALSAVISKGGSDSYYSLNRLLLPK